MRASRGGGACTTARSPSGWGLARPPGGGRPRARGPRGGPRPPAGLRPPVLERLAGEIRAALQAPDLNPDSPAELLRVLQAAGLQVGDTRSWTLEQLDHPCIPALLEYKKLNRLLTNNGWNWLDTWARDGR